MRRWSASAALVLMAAWSPLHAETRGVVELFTSQGCSSCPPADKLLGELARDRSLIALSLPVDYWDYLGWKDTLAKPGHSARQRGYAHMRGDREVYTPQIVVNGTKHVLGSDPAAIEAAIAETRENADVLSIDVKLSIADGKATVSLPAAARSGGILAQIWVCPVTPTVTVAVGRGENRGHSLVYHNVVRRWVKAGDWNGEAKSYTVPLAQFETDKAEAVAVLVQSGRLDDPGAMLGAAIAPIVAPR